MNGTKKLMIPGIITAVIVSIALIGIVLLSQNKDNPEPSGPTVTEEKEPVTTPYEEEVIEDYNLFTDDNPVLVQVGINGEIEETYQVTKDKDGNVVSREKTGEQTLIEKQNRIIRQGMLDRVETTDTIKTKVQDYFDALKEKNISDVYASLCEEDRMYYSKDQLTKSATDIGFVIESYSLTKDISYRYPDYLSKHDASLVPLEQRSEEDETEDETTTEDTQKGLVALMPITMVFDSTTIGRQEVQIDLLIKHEGQDWNIVYVGPTEVIKIDKSQARDDGGKTYGNPIGAKVTINNAILFANLDRLYFDYTLENTSNENYKDIDKKEFIVTNAHISSVTLYDDPETGYQLLENVLFQQGSNEVYIDQTAVGRWLFSPVPGPDIERIYITLQLMVGEYTVDIDFGEINLTRQHRQQDYKTEDAITDTSAEDTYVDEGN